MPADSAGKINNTEQVMTYVQNVTRLVEDADRLLPTGDEGTTYNDVASWLSPQESIDGQQFSELDVSIPDEDRIFWCFMKPQLRPSFTAQLLRDLAAMQGMISRMFASSQGNSPPFDYFVLGSRSEEVFNLGGDLTLFAEKIRQRDREGLRQYAHACVDSGYANYTGYDQGIVTIALMQGDALGGGLEAALSCDLLIAERHAKFGLPEVLFNLFPGMGAYTFLSRRIGRARTEEMIMSGKLYSADEMLALGAIDMVVDQGQGEMAVREFVIRNRSRFTARSAMCKIRRRVDQIAIKELRDIADLWVDAALRLSDHDLRKMARIATAQDRFRSRTSERRLAAEA